MKSHPDRSHRKSQNCVPARAGTCFVLLAFLATSVGAQDAPQDLTKLSLNDLVNVRVSSASKKEQKLFQTATAIYVITQEDIRRSGMTSIPDLLRLVPGMDVAHVDASKWAITARGFNGRFANKMLVLVDGRTVYSPLFAGVYWEVQDVLLPDIERIEVIRGPGATLWGSNAVNGVINIITKGAKDTQGGLIAAGSGMQEHGIGGFRYGGKLGAKTHFRFYAKHYNRGESVDANGGAAGDAWWSVRGGFRFDSDISVRDLLTVQGDLYRNHEDQRVNRALLTPPFSQAIDAPLRAVGGNFLTRWTRTYSPRQQLSLQFYFDRVDRFEVREGESVQMADVNFEHRFGIGMRHDIVWGASYRHIADRMDATFFLLVSPATRRQYMLNTFVQDEITLVKDRLKLVAGIKLEHNRYARLENEPSLRLLWTPSLRQAFWFAYSKADRLPTRAEDSIRVNYAAFPGPGGLTALVTINGNPDFEDEELKAFELGYRVQPSHRFSVDLATFYNWYKNLRTQEPGVPFLETSPLPPHIVAPLVFSNLMHGEAYGAEIATTWNVTNDWKLTGAYSWLTLQLHREVTSLDPAVESSERDSPRNQFQIRSELNLPRQVELDTSIFFTGQRTSMSVPRHTRVDLRIGWRPAERWELSLMGQNLLSPRHAEFAKTELNPPTYDKRRIFGKITWRF